MGRLILRRTLWSIPLLLVVTFLLFWMVRGAFDPTARLRQSRDPNVIAAERERLGLDKPIVEQYRIWFQDFIGGDWGESQRTGRDVLTEVRNAFGNTIQIIAWGGLLSGVIAMAIGVYSAMKQYSVGDYFFTALTYIGISMPPFWFGLIAIHWLAVEPKSWFGMDEVPLYFVGLHSTGSSGFNFDYLRHLVLPVMTLSVQIVASWARYQRASTLEVLGSDYIRTARAKGVPRRRVIMRHAVRNALIPLVTVMAVDVGLLFGGLIITEFIFSINGMGRLFFDSLTSGDTPVLEAWAVVTGVFVLLFNLLADLLYGWLDPRIRVQ